jgi:cysteine desulfuration protein SufE
MTSVDELVENFELLGDWDQRYEYIMDLGNRLAALPDEDKTDATKVHACMSNVYIVGDLSRDEPATVTYRAECDTPVIRGVIAILLMVYTGKTPAEALALDADDLFDRLGLFDHLSPTRHVGVYAIVERIRTVAREHLAVH